MLAQLTKQGDSHYLIIGMENFEPLNINFDTVFNISTDGEKMTIQPVEQESEGVSEELAPFLKDINNRYGETLKRLA
ncbi:MAG: hypothetical protein LBU65_10500 [Planctomycetaceae bacterium]|jgi:hypothetical protein|nr:hypothetical protein [Planctomycetaceae bacterium]